MSRTATRIRDYAIIGDGRSTALVSRAGSIDWLCWPRFESPSLFAAILDDDGGHFRVAPRAVVETGRWYAPGTNVLETWFRAPGARVRLTDLMPVASEEEKRGTFQPEHEILRVLDCEVGEAEIEVSFRPRADYGRRATRLRAAGALGLRIEDGSDLYTLRSEVPLAVGDGEAGATFKIREGERVCFSLTYDREGPAVLPALGPQAAVTIERTIRWWREWVARCSYTGPYRAQVMRSLLALKLLSYAPSGAIVAAPTTSLPERIGGTLNWDYRYCWLRDASLIARVLYKLGFCAEADAFVGWLLHTTRLTRPELAVLYDVYGERPAAEEILPHLAGHRRSAPVRIRNAASTQLQLDTYGEVIDAVAATVDRDAPLDHTTQAMLRRFGDFVCHNWRRPDQGIWEPRGAPREWTHSRLLCWTALDRLLSLERDGLLAGVDVAAMSAEREAIRRDIEGRAWNQQLGAYAATLGGDELDASVLLMSWYGFVPPRDARLHRTYRRIQQQLSIAPALISRNRESLARGESAFGVCCFWAVEYLAAGGGSLREAEVMFERLLECANDVGLFAEQIDRSGDLVGNFPQAFTHVGLVAAALAIEERRAADSRPRATAARPVSRPTTMEVHA